MSPNEQRYEYLKIGKRYSLDDPYVINTRKSRLYAVRAYTGEDLDIAIDIAILDLKIQELHVHNEVVERGRLPEGMYPCVMEEDYCDLLEQIAFEDLKFDSLRIQKIRMARDEK